MVFIKYIKSQSLIWSSAGKIYASTTTDNICISRIVGLKTFLNIRIFMHRLLLTGLLTFIPSITFAYDFISTFPVSEYGSSPGLNQENGIGTIYLSPSQVAQLNTIEIAARLKEITRVNAFCLATPAEDRDLSVTYSEEFTLKFYSTPAMGGLHTHLYDADVGIRTNTSASMVVNTFGPQLSEPDIDIKRNARVEIPSSLASALRNTGEALIIQVIRRGVSEEITQEGNECYVSNASFAQGTVTVKINW